MIVQNVIVNEIKAEKFAGDNKYFGWVNIIIDEKVPKNWKYDSKLFFHQLKYFIQNYDLVNLQTGRKCFQISKIYLQMI